MGPSNPCAVATTGTTTPPAPSSPCAVANVPPTPSDPCAVASFARLSDGEGTVGKKSQTSAFSPVNVGMFGFCALCVAGIAVAAKKMKRKTETRSYHSLPPKVGAPEDMESGMLELLAEDPVE